MEKKEVIRKTSVGKSTLSSKLITLQGKGKRRKERKKERKSRRSRSREKSLEKDDRRTKANSPHPEGRVGRVAREELTDRDSDDSDRDVRECEKELLAVKEKSKAIEDKLDR